jgi:hypothetical protein
MKLLLEVDIDDITASTYQNLSPEKKQQFNRYLCRILHKVAKKESVNKLKEIVADLQSQPGCSINPEILYLLFQGEED